MNMQTSKLLSILSLITAIYQLKKKYLEKILRQNKSIFIVFVQYVHALFF